MEILLLFLGGIVGVICTVLFQEPFQRFCTNARQSYRRLRIKIARKRMSPSAMPERTRQQHFHLGDVQTTWLVLDGDGSQPYDPDLLECRYDSTAWSLPDDIQQHRRMIEADQAQKKMDGLDHLWNGKRYTLDRFVIGRTPWEEKPTLQLCFGPSDYYTFLATNMNPDESLRQRYIKGVDWMKPPKYFSNSFGISICVITSDEYLVFTQRSNLVGSRHSEFNVSINEGLSRDLDRADEKHVPDPQRCAVRGAAEELRIEIPKKSVKFLSFGVDTRLAQYGLLGFARVDHSFEDVRRARVSGVKDKWENSAIDSAPLDLKEVCEFLTHKGPWAPSALACVYHILVHEFGHRRVDQAVSRMDG